METRLLRYFLAIAREQNISKAAEVLHISQPSLSRQLKSLEDNLGKQLIVRGKRKVTLTDDGVFLEKKAEEIISMIDKTTEEIRSTDDSVSGTVEIGCGESESMRLVSKTMLKLQKIHPDIKYNVVSRNTASVIELLDKGLIDFGVLIMPVDLQNYNYLHLPTSNSWGILMRKDSPIASKPVITPKDLIDLPLIAPKKALMRNEISGWICGRHKKLNIVAYYNLLYNASLMVEEGLGYALCLDKIIHTDGDSPLCFKPLSPPIKIESVIAWKKYQVFTKAAEKFLELLNDI